MSNLSSPSNNPKYAWRDLAGLGLPKRSASQRVADFLEIYGPFTETEAREQATRCIQCPNPTCVHGCPLCNPIPQWMQLTAEGRFLEAAAVLGSVTNMAEICARVCPSDRLCEHTCILESISQPVSVRALEQFLMDFAAAQGQPNTATAPPNGRKVAIAGSGPGALACADDLAQKGYSVTIYDSALVPGGLLVNGVPAFKIDRSILQRRLDILKQRGVRFQLGVRLWTEISLAQLLRQSDAVYLGVDARQARALSIPGSNSRGVVPALSFLLQKNTPVPLDLPDIPVAGKTVLVIGGGDTAVYCLRTALRYGAKAAIGVYRRGENDMPSGSAARIEATEEGAQFYFDVAPIAVIANAEEAVTGLKCARTQPAEQGRAPAIQPNTEFELQADLIIPALGFDPLPWSGDFNSLTADSTGRVAVNDQQMTSLPGVFAGGDLIRGPSTLLHAVRDGRQAASHIHNYLSSQ